MKSNNTIYNDVYVGGCYHKIAAMFWDDNNTIKYIIGTFYTKQQFDNCLTLLQEGSSIRYNGTYFYGKRKTFIGKCTRSNDENNSDGVHAVIYDQLDENILKVYKGENRVDKVFEWVLSNTQSGLIEDWKEYIVEELSDRGLIQICNGFDNTGRAPELYVLSKEINTELIRNIKSYGLKNGFIKLPVENVKKLDPHMSFLDIIQELILPYVENQNCQYNVGDEISPSLLKPMVSKTGKVMNLYPKQVVLAQGIINAIKDGVPYNILCGGVGVGKTRIMAKITIALIEEYFKKENIRVALLAPGHLYKKWIEELKECLNPLGIYPNFYIMNNFADAKKVPKEPKGLDIVILPRDRAKRKWLIEEAAKNTKFNRHLKLEAQKEISHIKDNKEAAILINKYDSSLRTMKYVAYKLKMLYKKHIVLYKEIINANDEVVGYKVTVTSSVMKKGMGTLNKSYDFKVKSLDEINKFISSNIIEIMGEKILEKEDEYIPNGLQCPTCGGYLYKNSDHLFDQEKVREFKQYETNLKTEYKYCNSYIKADGTSLTEYEKDLIRRDILSYKVVKEFTKFPYLNSDEEELTGEELKDFKKNPKKFENYIILLKKCGHKQWGVKDAKGYRCEVTTKYLQRLLGKKCFDLSLVDELHEYSSASNQGYVFADICKMSKVVIPCSGSITGGKASDLFLILFRLSPKTMIKHGYGYNDIERFIDDFGRRKQEIVTYKEAVNQSGRTLDKGWREIPGISPALYDLLLSNTMVCRKIEDMQVKLPPLRFFKHDIEMSEPLKDAYNNLHNQFTNFVNKNKHIPIGGALINNLLCYPNNPTLGPVTLSDGTVVAIPKQLDIEDSLLAKERKLIDTIKKELAQNRRCMVYACYTGEKGVGDRLFHVLNKEFKVAVLESSKIKQEKRAEWIEQMYQDGVEVIIAHPKTVATGLDILQYPTAYFYEIPLSTKILRQVEARNYRISSTQEARIYYSYYKGTLQEDMIILQSQKKRSSLSLEGVFSEDLLSQLATSEQTIESMLNDVLKGKIQLKENDFQIDFDEEETTFSFEENDEGDVEITKTHITKQKTIMTSQEVSQLTLFTIDDEFIRSRKNKKISPVTGQLGFLFE